MKKDEKKWKSKKKKKKKNGKHTQKKLGRSKSKKRHKMTKKPKNIHYKYNVWKKSKDSPRTWSKEERISEWRSRKVKKNKSRIIWTRSANKRKEYVDK